MITVLSGPRIPLAVFSTMSRGGSLSLRVEMVHHYIPRPNSKMQDMEEGRYSPSLSWHKLGGKVHTLLTTQWPKLYHKITSNYKRIWEMYLLYCFMPTKDFCYS